MDPVPQCLTPAVEPVVKTPTLTFDRGAFISLCFIVILWLNNNPGRGGGGGHGGTVVTHSPPTSEVVGSNPRSLFGKVGSCLTLGSSSHYRALTPTVCTGFLRPQNYPSWYMTCTVLYCIVYLYSAQYLHILQDSKRYLNNPTVQVQPPNWQVTDIPLTGRYRLKDDHLSTSLRFFNLPLETGPNDRRPPF